MVNIGDLIQYKSKYYIVQDKYGKTCNIIDLDENKVISDLKFFNNNCINMAPKPYIGQYGPVINPLFINFFSQKDLYTDSNIHPDIEYIIK